MPMFEHACFISFPNEAGHATVFANAFYDELQDQIAVYDKHLSIFKWDRCEERRKGDDWTLWIQRELCHSAMMISVCPPTYFNGSEGCVSEFDGMERLLAQRAQVLAGAPLEWIIGLRLKEGIPLPKLNPHPVVDFFSCCDSPQEVRRVRAKRQEVGKLADRIWKHWDHLNSHPNNGALQAADLCGSFGFRRVSLAASDPFPHAGGAK